MSDDRNTDRRRRELLAAGAALTGGATFGWVIPVHAQGAARVITPPQALGPFYPNPLPVEQDADLTSMQGASGVAKGELLHLSGLVFDAQGRPARGARVEIWQCNANGRYHHPRDRSDAALDPNFQGFGAARTDDAGGYRFKTIHPVPYPGRTPHIHFRVHGPGLPDFVTQMYVAGHPQNAGDPLLSSIADRRQRDSLLASFQRIAGTAEWTAKFDLVLPPRA